MPRFILRAAWRGAGTVDALRCIANARCRDHGAAQLCAHRLAAGDAPPRRGQHDGDRAAGSWWRSQSKGTTYGRDELAQMLQQSVRVQAPQVRATRARGRPRLGGTWRSRHPSADAASPLPGRPG
eukprot:scaffold1591_cov109-Isochrysis_galbana.AAC.9